MNLVKMSARDRARLFLSTPEEFQVWYGEQDPRELIIANDDKQFQSFVYWSYTWKVRLLRFWFTIKHKMVTLIKLHG